MENQSYFNETYGGFKLAGVRVGHRVYHNDEAGLVALVATDNAIVRGREIEELVANKGAMMTSISAAWAKVIDTAGDMGKIPLTSFCYTDKVTATYTLGEFPYELRHPELEGRTTVVSGLSILPVDFVVTGYMQGVIWRKYLHGIRTFHGVKLPNGMDFGDKLPGSIIYVVEKNSGVAPQYGDDLEDAVELVPYLSAKGWTPKLVGSGQKRYLYGAAKRLVLKCLNTYAMVERHAARRGLILAEARFSLGVGDSSDVYLGGLNLTPDLSTYWIGSPTEETEFTSSPEKLHDFYQEIMSRMVK